MGKIVKAVAIIAVTVAISLYAPQLAPAFLSAAIGTAAAAAVTAAVLTVAATVALNTIFPPPRAATASPQMTRVAVGAAQILYGERRPTVVQIIFYHPKKVGKRHYRYFVLAVAGHRCKGVKAWMLNDEVVTVNAGTGAVTSGKYANAAWLWFARGTDDQAANPTFVAECDGKWTTNHRGRGVALIYAKFEMTDDVVQAGMPLIAPVVEGKDDVRDPRTGVEGYTRLATPIMYDWMALPREEGGFGAAPDEIPDDDLLSPWTNICDENVSIGGGVTEKRYELDCCILTGSAPSEVRQTFLTCTAGSYTYTGGKFLLRPGYWNPVSASLSEDDLAGAIRIPLLNNAEMVATEVSGTFVDPGANYQPQPVPTRTFPGADIRQLSFDLAHITSSTRGQRILEIMGRRAQCEKRVTWPMNIAGLAVQALDTVQLDTSRYSLSNYAWVVDGWGMSQDFSVVLNLREENEEIYADAIGFGAAPVPPALAAAEVIADTVATGAVGIKTRSVGYPVTSTTNSVSIAAFSGVLDDGRTIAFPAATVGGLAEGTNYAVFFNPATGAYTLSLDAALIEFANRDLIFLERVATALSGGGYAEEETPPGSWRGDRSNYQVP